MYMAKIRVHSTTLRPTKRTTNIQKAKQEILYIANLPNYYHNNIEKLELSCYEINKLIEKKERKQSNISNI